MWASLPAVFMAYAAMTRFFNSLVIDITPDSITVDQTPLPWALRRGVSTRNAAAVRIKVRRLHYRGTGPLDNCHISLELTNGKRSMLVRGLEMSALEMSGIAADISDYLRVPMHADYLALR